MLNRYLKEEKFTLLSFLILTLLIFSPYILHLKSFTLGFDYQNQHLYFYEEFHRLLSSGEAPFWSWNLFLGTNFIGSKTYYLLGDPNTFIPRFKNDGSSLLHHSFKTICRTHWGKCFFERNGNQITNEIYSIHHVHFLWLGLFIR